MREADKLRAAPTEEDEASKNISGPQRDIAYDQPDDARNNSI